MTILGSERFEINTKNKLIEKGQIVYAQIGRDLFEMKHIKTISNIECMINTLKEHTVYLLCDGE